MLIQVTAACQVYEGDATLARRIFGGITSAIGAQCGYVVLPDPSGFRVMAMYEGMSETAVRADFRSLKQAASKRISTESERIGLFWRNERLDNVR
ncbi:MAG: hypothetical protein K0U93_12375 [Gammaproteobacteria bacterium]|nr:hypothetical protein [Gammaproteobacteria bacterium]